MDGCRIIEIRKIRSIKMLAYNVKYIAFGKRMTDAWK
jgi:hypothetical protein